MLPDPAGDTIGWIRIVDESGEDYLYPESLFQPIDVPATLEQELLRIS